MFTEECKYFFNLPAVLTSGELPFKIMLTGSVLFVYYPLKSKPSVIIFYYLHKFKLSKSRDKQDNT